jgi:hypothetical protein
MNLDIFKKEDPSGKMSKESYILKNHREEYDYIVNYCEENEIFDIPFKEKIYLCLNSLKKRPLCKNPNCNGLVKFRNSTIGYLKYCSNRCISSDPDIIKIKEEKSIEKFGTKAPAQSKEIRDKIIETNQRKYGSNSPMCDEVVKNKSKKTLMCNWGVDNPSKSKEILEKRVDKFRENIDQYKESYKKTSLDKYGVDHPWKNPLIHKKTIDFFYKNYKERITNNLDKDFEFIDFKLADKTNLLFKCKKCNKDFEILTYQFYWRKNSNKSICTLCYPISDTSSIVESEVLEFIRENYNGLIIPNDSNSIKPYEIDILLPGLKLGFEFNGVFWHSDKFKNKNYHLNKLNKAIDNKLRLITIWEDDWNIKRDICKSFILNKLGKSNKIWARKCKLQMVSYDESKTFLDENHLQGDCKSSIRIGLYFNNVLVSLMTFSKLRLPVGGKSKKDIWELTRFCNKIDNVVVGGASKLLKYFIKIKNPIEIQSYSDNMISDGDLYSSLGFQYSHTSKPGYWYVINGIRYHRFNFRKDKLVKEGASPNKFEHEIMEEKGHLRVWSAGNKKWIFYNN